MKSIKSCQYNLKIIRGITIIILIFIFLSTSNLFTEVKQRWVARYNYSGNGWEEAADIGVDGSGNIYVTGSSDSITGSVNNFDYATVKYNSSGVQQWVARYNGPGNSYDEAHAIALDSSDNIYVTGDCWGSTGSIDFATIKYDINGVQKWVALYNGYENYSDEPSDIAVDNFGNVYVTGTSNVSQVPFNYDYDYTTIKYNSVGVQQWARRYTGLGKRDWGGAIAVDNVGNVYVTGESEGSGTGYDCATIKYDSNGNVFWVARYNGLFGNRDDEGIDVAVDNLGNVYVTGYSDWALGANSSDYVTIKYNSSGVEQWMSRYNGLGNGDDFASAMVLDNLGNVYVTGSISDLMSESDYVTIKYNGEGIQQWVARYNGPGNSYDTAMDIVLDNFGSVYVTGSSQGSGTQEDYATVKYNSAGVEQWVMRYNGVENGSDTANAIAIDYMNNVYVTGTSGTGATLIFYYTTIKYSQGLSVNQNIWMNY